MINILSEIWALLCEMSPYLLLGFLLVGLMHEFVPGTLYTRYLGDRSLRSVVLAALFGVPLPLCSCGVIPTAMGIRREGASKGATISFLIATPQTGVDSIGLFSYICTGLLLLLVRALWPFGHHHHHHHEALSHAEARGVTYNIEGMNCNHCAENVRKAIASLEGVEGVEVSLREGKAIVTGSPDEAEVLRAVESIGFKAAADAEK